MVINLSYDPLWSVFKRRVQVIICSRLLPLDVIRLREVYRIVIPLNSRKLIKLALCLKPRIKPPRFHPAIWANK